MQLLSCYLFQKLSQSQIEQIAAITQEQQIQKGQWLFHKGQKATHIYLVKEGAIELVIKVEDTIEIPIAVIRPNDGCVGIGALVEPYLYSLSARCLNDSTLLVIEQPKLQNLMRSNPELGCTIMSNLAQKLLARLKETRQEVKIHFMNLVRSASF
ncbi:MAG: cyclic nucleotide-binding domain-containing protein [Desulfobacterales bacterium]|jgi:CRP-like cAMP-binding protein|nr:MAG: cyclic nucleotide-binding domain-containing protein [Desulfobacterales bacterium]